MSRRISAAAGAAKAGEPARAGMLVRKGMLELADQVARLLKPAGKAGPKTEDHRCSEGDLGEGGDGGAARGHICGLGRA